MMACKAPHGKTLSDLPSFYLLLSSHTGLLPQGLFHAAPTARNPFLPDSFMSCSLTFFRDLFKCHFFSGAFSNHKTAPAYPLLPLSSSLLYYHYLEHSLAISLTLYLLLYLLSDSISTIPSFLEYAFQEGSSFNTLPIRV